METQWLFHPSQTRVALLTRGRKPSHQPSEQRRRCRHLSVPGLKLLRHHRQQRSQPARCMWVSLRACRYRRVSLLSWKFSKLADRLACSHWTVGSVDSQQACTGGCESLFALGLHLTRYRWRITSGWMNWTLAFLSLYGTQWSSKCWHFYRHNTKRVNFLSVWSKFFFATKT